MTEERRGESPDDPAEGARDAVDRELEASPAKGVLDEDDPDPPEPSEPA
jgi:hypothetical protein